MTAVPTSAHLRQEAKLMRQSGERVWVESEETLLRAKALIRCAQQLEAQADELDDVAQIQRLSGGAVTIRRKERTA